MNREKRKEERERERERKRESYHRFFERYFCMCKLSGEYSEPVIFKPLYNSIWALLLQTRKIISEGD